jgi:hypothetical protein
VLKGAIPNDVVDDQGDTVFQLERQAGTNATIAKINITFDQMQDYQEKIEAATLVGGWDALNAEADLFDHQVSDKTRTQRAYIAHYFNAYFREGKFFKAEIDASQLKKKIIEKLKDQIPGLDNAAYDDLVKRLFPEYKDTFDDNTSKYIFGKIEDTGFVTPGQIFTSGVTVSSPWELPT